MVERLFLGVPRGCLRFMIVVFPDHTHLLFLVIITPVLDHCYFISYSQTLFANVLVSIVNKFCICSFILRIFQSFHDVFTKLVPQSSNWQFKQGISYLFSDLIVLGYTSRHFDINLTLPFDIMTL